MGVIQRYSEWAGIRNRLKKGILHAPICKLLKIIYLPYGNLGFIRDNTFINIASTTENWFDENGIPLVD